MGFALVPQLRHDRRWTHHRAATTAAIQIYWAQTAIASGGLGAGPTSRLPSRITIGDGADTSQSPVPMATMAATDGLRSSEDEAPG
ncbi:hypothetical protein N7541_008135 [Penicillium brevicompactum]|uniref:Uncharacterized protein n=1 Tax=Penicillium brevicompactum TaxID=5074 RepID=A0A9W9UMC9_PENBR|nr:hypothetical protein N7541_008135 [Penicillium brevicompactum]